MSKRPEWSSPPNFKESFSSAARARTRYRRNLVGICETKTIERAGIRRQAIRPHGDNWAPDFLSRHTRGHQRKNGGGRDFSTLRPPTGREPGPTAEPDSLHGREASGANSCCEAHLAPPYTGPVPLRALERSTQAGVYGDCGAQNVRIVVCRAGMRGLQENHDAGFLGDWLLPGRYGYVFDAGTRCDSRRARCGS